MSNATIYEVGLNELHRVSQDKHIHDQIDNEFREARGREGARLHVTLRAISEAERRQQENSQATWNAIGRLTQELNERAAALTQLIQSFEGNQDKRVAGVAEQARVIQQAVQETRAAVSSQVQETRAAISSQIQETRAAVSSQNDAHFQALSSQARENTERLAVDLRHVRDEVVGLIDSRMTQADASFAALRGDVEVVKFLVMDLIKDRIGRSDPKQKPF
ncbi:MAG TPA: hypothetical protein VFH78_10830 [Candidatus Thermoplasmatota archaeon]|nr:hypothetical protein [Candidatus Thermoplasmatota archaeon]